MRTRILILAMLFLLRLFPGWLNVINAQDNRKVRVTGKGNIMYQNATKCTGYIGYYYFDIQGYCSFSRGDKISVVGTIDKRLIDIFFGNLWLSSAKIDVNASASKVSVLDESRSSIFDKFRENLTARYQKIMPAKESALVAGIVLGDKSSISKEFNDEMIKSGTIHIVVASGYNVLLVGGTLLSLFFWVVRRKAATVLAILGMVGYALLTGAGSPVIRAVIMAGMVYLGAVIGRRQLGWWTLLLTGWSMVMVDVSQLKSASFQLSIAASVGLLVVEPWLKSISDVLRSRLIHIFSNIGILTTFSTLLMTAPIIWWHFGRFSLVGLVSNIFVLPIIPILMILGVLVLILPVFSWPIYILAHLAVILIGWFGA